MAKTIEVAYGREALVSTLCQPADLLRAYERATATDSTLPRWSRAVMTRLPRSG